MKTASASSCLPSGEGEVLKLISLNPEQKFTQPPPRFSEGLLVRELEENGIGRPSTYATIISTIQDREYVRLEKGKFIPTDLGILVTDLLVKNFPESSTRPSPHRWRRSLTRSRREKVKRLDTLNGFLPPFAEELRKAKATMRNVKQEETPTDLVCEKCGKPMVIKWGKERPVSRLYELSRVQEYDEFHAGREGGNPAGGETDHGYPLPPLRQADVRPPGPLREVSRLHRLPGMQTYDQRRPGWGAGRRPGSGKKRATPSARNAGNRWSSREAVSGPFLGCSGYPECKNIVRTPGAHRPALRPPRLNSATFPATSAGSRWPSSRADTGNFSAAPAIRGAATS